MRGHDKSHATRRVNYQKVLLALYMTAGDDGLWSIATNVDIGRAAGLRAETAGSYLRDLERDGVVEIFRPAEFGLSCRRMILCDHPDAAEESRFMWKVYGNGRRRPRAKRPKQEA